MTNNVDDLASYLKYQSLLFTSDAVNETAPGSAGGLFTDTAISALASSSAANVQVDGQSSWSVNPLDLLANPPLSFTYNATNNLTNSNYVGLIPLTSAAGNAGLGFVTSFDFATDPNTVSLSDLSSFYQTNGFLASSAQWQDVSGTYLPLPANSSSLTTASSFWTATTENKKILQYWLDIQSANGVYNKTAPPATFQQFVQAMQNVQLTSPASIPPGSLQQAGQFTNTTAGVTLSPAAPPTASTSSQIFNGLLGSFIANYQTYFPTPTGGTVTPQQFATQFESFVQNDLQSVLANTSINVNISDGSAGGPVVLKQITASSIAGSNIGSSITFPAGFASQFSTDLFNEYSSALQTSTDWQGVTPPTLDLQSNYNKSFNYFLQQLTTNSTLSAQGQNFFTMWSEFVGPSTFLQTASNGSATNELSTYLQMYNVFYPDQPQLFASRLSSFIQDALNAPAGVFNPSLLIDQWFSKLQTGFANLTTTLDAANFSNVQIIGQVFQSLVDVINDLQNLTLAQANRLNFYSQYSQAYTNEIYNVPFLLPGDGTPISLAADPASSIATGTGSQNVQTGPSASVQASTFRQQADTAANQWIQNLQNYRTTVTANAQTQQTSVQTSNAGVNQQTNFATTLLQMLNQLLQSVFHAKAGGNG